MSPLLFHVPLALPTAAALPVSLATTNLASAGAIGFDLGVLRRELMPGIAMRLSGVFTCGAATTAEIFFSGARNQVVLPVHASPMGTVFLGVAFIGLMAVMIYVMAIRDGSYETFVGVSVRANDSAPHLEGSVALAIQRRIPRPTFVGIFADDLREESRVVLFGGRHLTTVQYPYSRQGSRGGN